MKNWTDEQKQAIFSKWCDDKKTKSSNILVNAAAGSGKTAVLVERIINKLSADENSPDFANVSDILVVTFTNAAAKEMKQRISASLNSKFSDALSMNDTLSAERLKKQLRLIDNGDITTIDSFCLKIVKNYFHLINLDPNFRIADNAECELMKDEVIEELFDKKYSDEKFINLACLLTDGRDISEISDLIRNLFDFTRSLPDPILWLNEKKEALKINNENNIWFDIIKDKIKNEITYANKTLKQALKIMLVNVFGEISNDSFTDILNRNQPEEENDVYLSFGTYYTAIYNEYMFTLSVLNAETWNEIYDIFKKVNFINLRTAPKFKDKERIITDKEILTELKNARDTAKECILAILPLVNTSAEEIYKISNQNIYPMISDIIDLCVEFEEMYNSLKRDKNVLEFYDVEHLCLKIIRENDDVLKSLQDKYDEILIDEYQDTNQLQEEIFSKISRGDNMYMVGDMKQSIYRFRSSDPTIFKSKNNIFKRDQSSENKKIILSKNFRSRKEILESVNSVFKKIMSDEIGEIEYDIEQQLNLGNTEYVNENDNYVSECCVILSNSNDDVIDENLNTTQIEARFIAKKIKELKDSNFKVLDKKTIKTVDDKGNETEEEINYYRPIQNKDIAIITSSHKNISSIYQEELSNLGIDCFADVGGYFKKNEITMALSLLKMINNPYNDLSLIATMRTPVFGFSDDELCEIKLCGGNSYYDCLKTAAENLELPLKDKCQQFINKINVWRGYKKIMPCDKLIWTLYEETGLYSFCESIYGEDAASNLRLLFVRANAFEASGYRGLFNFIRYIAKMEKREEDLSSAINLGENSDVVRLMTIHKSKGLEFPVVFLAGCSKKFNTSDIKRKVLFHKDFGFGADFIDLENNCYEKTLQKNAIILKINNEIISEEMRKLYVAMTRAKEKLFVTAVCKNKNTEEFKEELPVEYERWNKLNTDERFFKMYTSSVNRFIDWIAPVAMKDNENWNFNIIPYKEAQKIELPLEENSMIESGDKQIKFDLSNKEYRFEKSTIIPTKLSVTQVKNLSGDINFDLEKKPTFIYENQPLSGAEKGTAIHYLLQKFNPKEYVTEKEVSDFIEILLKNEEISQEEAKSINPKDICDFYSTDIGVRILKSKKVFKESPFEIEVPVDEISDFDSKEKVILQGIIDCYFYEGDDIVLVDYKTDNSKNINQIKEKYRQQMHLYKLAIEKITKKNVKNQIIYLFSSKSMIEY